MNIFPVTYSTLSVKALEHAVLSKYDLELPLECQVFSKGLNDTFLVKANGNKYILRAYRFGWRSLEDIYYELELLQYLHHQGIAVSIPIAQKDGTLVEIIQAPEGERHIVLFSYAPGTFPNFETHEENTAYLYGKAVAKIHNATDFFESKHERFKIDLEHLLDKPLESIQPFLKHRLDDWNYLTELVEKLRTHIQNVPLSRLETGVCHGDFHGGNVHMDENNTFTFFDFDCCGEGYLAYDLAVFRWSARLNNKEKEDWPHFLRGYTEERPTQDVDLGAIPYFVAIRQIWLTGLHTGNAYDWGRSWLNDGYFDRTLEFFRKWEAEVWGEKASE
jgi:Ser/Thr protein kinase RdoA (MazF antagonist)